jgi:hypothetical protein
MTSVSLPYHMSSKLTCYQRETLKNCKVLVDDFSQSFIIYGKDITLNDSLDTTN